MRCITGHGAPSPAEATLPALQAPPQASTSTKPEPTLPFFFAWPGKKKLASSLSLSHHTKANPVKASLLTIPQEDDLFLPNDDRR